MSKTIAPTIVTLLLGAAAPAAAQMSVEARTTDGASVPSALPLVSQSLRVSIDRQFARTVLEQAYVNHTVGRIEGRALVRAGGSARVQGFAYWNGETKIVGEVFAKEAARQIYEETAGRRRDPGLLEEVGEGAFSFRVFPIEPNERKRVEVTLSQRLLRTGRTVEYRMPLGTPAGSAAAAADIVVEIEDSRPLSRLRSPTHTLSVDALPWGGQRARARSVGPASELVLQYDVDEKPFTVDAFVHRDPGEDAYLTVAMPTPADGTQVSPQDVTLVLDHSGSMSGEPMAQARAAAVAVVQRLSARDRVNVIAFDDRVDVLYPAPRPVTTEIRQDAIGYIDRIREAGGTNIGKALEEALVAQAANDSGRPHVILFFTDGQSDAEPVFAAAEKDRGDARVFTIGLGSGVNRPLLARLASMKRGRFTFIESADAIKPRVERLFTQIQAPVLVGVRVTAEGAHLSSVYPKSIPDLSAGDELVLAARASGAGPVTLKITGQISGKPVTYQTSLVLPPEARRPWVGRLWAAARTDDLQEEIALHGETSELKKEALDLALAYNFVTRYTSFLAVPESELPEAARSQIASMRAQKKTILAARPDAAALSRDEMPPGDPILTVRAPADARQVTAYFPFGLVKDLKWDARSASWKTRFLVPIEVADGDYQTQVLVVHADGAQEVVTVSYRIDSTAPDFEVETEPTAGGVRITVTTAESAREVVVALTANPRRRVYLTRDAAGTTFTGVLRLALGEYQARVVVADTARNESDDLITLTVGR